MNILSSLVAGIAVTVSCVSTDAFALCADVNDDTLTTASDSLIILKKAVGQNVMLNCSCSECGTTNNSTDALAYCADVSGDGTLTASDALTTLKKAVGQQVSLSCSCVACQTETTTTTLSGCPPQDGLDGRTFVEKYWCAEGSTCYAIESDKIAFTHQGGGSYEGRDVPDTGFVYNGSLSCTTFTWDALKPGDYSESGTWTFASDLSSFSGSSDYEALDHSYAGTCTETGAESPDTPPDPVPPDPVPPPACE